MSATFSDLDVFRCVDHLCIVYVVSISSSFFFFLLMLVVCRAFVLCVFLIGLVA